MKKLLVLALMLVAANAFAVVDPDPNGIGIYFDQTADNNCLLSAPQYSTVTAYLCVTNLTTNGISGWEASIRTNPATLPAGLTVTLFHGALNVLAPPLYNVGIPAVGGVAGNPVVLASFSTFYLGGPIEYAVGPCTPSSFGGLSAGFAAGDDPGLLTPLTPSCDLPFPGFDNTFLVASVAGASCPVATETNSWGNVKALYE
jgi:hypothetical protein